MSKERDEMNMFFRTVDIMSRSDSKELGDSNNRWYVYVLRRDGSQFISAISMDYDGAVETIGGPGDEMVAKCTVKPRGRAPVTRTFSVDDAKAAMLWGGSGLWKQYPQQMLQMRARGLAIRDALELPKIRVGDDDEQRTR